MALPRILHLLLGDAHALLTAGQCHDRLGSFSTEAANSAALLTSAFPQKLTSQKHDEFVPTLSYVLK
jgi:hypothetical protein